MSGTCPGHTRNDMFIGVEDTFLGHRKVKRLALRFGVSRAAIRGHLVTLWLNALNQATDGNLCDWDHGDIAEYSEWGGDAEAWASALIEFCLIDVADDGHLELHNWKRRRQAFYLVAARAAERGRKKDYRDNIRNSTPENEVLDDVPDMSGTCPANVPLKGKDRKGSYPPPILKGPELLEAVAAKRDWGKQAPLSPARQRRLEALGEVTDAELEWAATETEAKPGKPNVGMLLCKLEDARKQASAPKPTRVNGNGAQGPPPRARAKVEAEMAARHAADARREAEAASPEEQRKALADIVAQLEGGATAQAEH